ncbi:unnamed protein product [Cochlearia groenlandica]
MVVEEEVELDVEIKTQADKFHMFVRTSQNLSKASHHIQACDLFQGEWGKVGSIVLWKLVFGANGETRMSKDRIETIDVEKRVIQWRVLEGPVRKEYKSFLKTMKVSPNQREHGSVVTWNLKYERIDEKVAHPHSLLHFLIQVTKEVDLYLLSQE